MKKIYHYLFSMLFISMSFLSCEAPPEVIPTENKPTSETLSSVRSSSPRSFTLNITGGDYSVGIIDRFTDPPKITIVSPSMCPYNYLYQIPENVTPNYTDIEIIATNSSMRHIVGFCDDYGCYSHSGTYSYGVFWNGSQNITALFDPTNWRPDPLPPGIDDEGGSGGGETPPEYSNVSITVETMDVSIIIEYINRYGDLVKTSIAGVTMLNQIQTNYGVKMEITNSNSNYVKVHFHDGSGTTDELIAPFGTFSKTISPTSANYYYRIY